jgi:hypothetical protein
MARPTLTVTHSQRSETSIWRKLWNIGTETNPLSSLCLSLRSKSLRQWYIIKIVVFLDIINRPVFISNTQRFGDWTSSNDWAQLSRFHLKVETESSLRNVVFEIKTGRSIIVIIWHRQEMLTVQNKNRTMDNTQKDNNCMSVIIVSPLNAGNPGNTTHFSSRYGYKPMCYHSV